MNNFLIVLCFLMISPYLAKSQDWDLGVKGGVNVSKLRVVEGASTSSIIGFHLGGYASTSITDQISIQPEVQLSFQGYENENQENISLVYFNVPLLVKYYLADQFNVQAGPQFGFLIDAEDEREDFLKSTDVGITAGAEYKVIEKIGLGARYTLGLNNILDVSETTSEWRNRLFQLYATYSLSN